MKNNHLGSDEIRKSFVNDVRNIINEARATAVRSVDSCRVQMYWNIGRRIFEEEQQGKQRADYGTYLIKNLSQCIEPEYGSGFTIRQLERSRQFYRIYPIASTVRTQLNWSQYKLLISIPDPYKREYYELESYNHLVHDVHPLSHWYNGHFHQSWHSDIDGVLFKMLDIMEFTLINE